MSPWISDLYLRSQTDARLLSLTRDGHGRAFAILAERYRAELLAHAGRLSSTGNAEDLLQQTLLSAFAALNHGAEVGHARGWLHAILRHAAIRARAPVEAPLELATQTGEAADALLDARTDVRLVLSALDALPARQREALIGSTVQGLSRAELAATLGVSEGAVRQLVHRARSAIRTAITSLTPYPVLRWFTGPAGLGPPGPPEVMIATGAAGAASVAAKLGLVAAAGAIAASGLAGHHGSPRHMHAARPAPVRSTTATTVAGSARTGTDPRVTLASAGEFVAVSPGDAHRVTLPVRAAGGGGARATRWNGSGVGQAGSSAHGDRRGSFSGDRGDGGDGGGGGSDGGSRSQGGSSTTGRDGGSVGGSGDGTSRPLAGDGGSRGSAATGGSGGGGSGSESGATTMTTGPGISTPTATTASDAGGGSGDGGSNNGGGSASAAPGSAAGADGGQMAATSTTSTGSRDLSPPAGSSLATDH